LKDMVLPELLARKTALGSRSIRVWSAGCATGQEPYTAVMTILEGLPKSDVWSLRVYASDLSFSALERAQSGLYRADQLKGIDEHYVKKYFREEEGFFAVTDQVKDRVVFDYHNLKHDNGLRGIDIIFCRNVLIYFNTGGQRRLIDRF